MYSKAYGIIKTLAPLHVGASAGEESGNLNLIFRDQFTQTGIIPGSSIRGRFRADMRNNRQDWLESQLADRGITVPENFEEITQNAPSGDRQPDRMSILKWLEQQAKQWESEHEDSDAFTVPVSYKENRWYGHESVDNQKDGGTTEAIVKFEYASLVWLPVFCPGQPIVWVTCPYLLKRYKRIAAIAADLPLPYSAPSGLQARPLGTGRKVLFFNLGFLDIEHEADLSPWAAGFDIEHTQTVVVADNDIAILHDMALYRQSRVKLVDDMKKVDTDKGAFFNVEALPEGSVLVFPIALKHTGWQPFRPATPSQELYFGGLESVGFGRCQVTLGGTY
ncbi:MAG: type III-B CRISPR module RAMP protein Cmr4 [Tildeniella torsiva UHER 1998/13D]|jgi:CRISPR-associated protein Cmr4|nr:type III-B CRISPR module RAMP protein Cmr4 [Tildeniella torsiva UHER 1998/13D]